MSFFTDNNKKLIFSRVLILFIVFCVAMAGVVVLISSKPSTIESFSVDHRIPEASQDVHLENFTEEFDYLTKAEYDVLIERKITNTVEEIRKELDVEMKEFVDQFTAYMDNYLESSNKEYNDLRKEVRESISSYDVNRILHDINNMQDEIAQLRKEKDKLAQEVVFLEREVEDQKSRQSQDKQDRSGSIFPEDRYNITRNDVETIAFEGADSVLLVNERKDNDSSLIVNNQFPLEIEEPQYRIEEGISKGSLLPAKLEVGVISSLKEVPVLVRITKNINYKDYLLIPKGAIMTGVGRSDFTVRKIFIDLDTLIIGDKEIDIKARLVKEDGTPGFLSEYIDLSREHFWPNLLMRFAGRIGQTYKDTIYVADKDGNLVEVEADTFKNQIIDGTQDSIDAWTDILMNDARRQNAIMIVEAGHNGFVFIDEKISLDCFITE